MDVHFEVLSRAPAGYLPLRMVCAFSPPLTHCQCLRPGRWVWPSHTQPRSQSLLVYFFSASAQGCPVQPLPWLLRPLSDHLPSPSCALLHGVPGGIYKISQTLAGLRGSHLVCEYLT